MTDISDEYDKPERPVRNMTRVTISVEVELAWGLHDLSPEHRDDILSDNRRAESRALNRVLGIAAETETPLTFDVVGHLLHEDCSGTHEGPMLRAGSTLIQAQTWTRTPTFMHLIWSTT